MKVGKELFDSNMGKLKLADATSNIVFFCALVAAFNLVGKDFAVKKLAVDALILVNPKVFLHALFLNA